MIEVVMHLDSAVSSSRDCVLGSLYIANDGTGTLERRNYDVYLMRKPKRGNPAVPPRELTCPSHPDYAKRPKAHRRARVEGHASDAYPPLVLVQKALNALYPQHAGKPAGTPK